MELVAVSRVVDKESFAIDVGNVDGLSQEELFKIEETQKELVQTVINMDSNTDNKCFDGVLKSL
eukprot:5203610-Ditylum_brightwellii.AAC.1